VKELVWCFSSGAGTNDMWDTTSPHGICNMTVNPISSISTTSTNAVTFSNIAGPIYDSNANYIDMDSLTSNLVGTISSSSSTVTFSNIAGPIYENNGDYIDMDSLTSNLVGTISSSTVTFSNIAGPIYDNNADYIDMVSLTSNLVGAVLTTTTDVTVPFNPNVIGSPHLKISSNTAVTSSGFWLEEPEQAVSGDYSVGPMSEFKLIMNGDDRFRAQSGKYFNQVQPYNHHSGNPYPGIYCYSFALKPEEHQPSGTCNFSRIDTVQASVKMKNNVDTTSLNMFAVNYNILRIEAGMGGLAFSN
jgi:hypothetical protein